MDLDKMQTLGVPVSDAYNALQTFLGGLYMNDFNRFSHTWQVLVQAEPEFRSGPPTSIASMCAAMTATWCRSARWPRRSPPRDRM